MKMKKRRGTTQTLGLALVLSTAVIYGLWTAGPIVAQGPGTDSAQWTYLGGDSWHTRYTPADQITPENFHELDVAWRWDAGSFGPSTARATPTLSTAN